MAEKDKVRVLFGFDADGYIIGWQQEFYDGEQWQAPFDTTGAVEVAAPDLATIVLGATKWVNGKLVINPDKQAELEAEANKVTPTAEQKMIASLMLRMMAIEKGDTSE
ncbi:phage infection protein [Lacticaseibacillus songhuajiangensis]|uniref:phage infection protein n=1 Tax=Lacticaseibacillus songhuajiangensis TaxID=1296539 RepID=UPI000F78B8C9|nr:phage infection protein [Lacticaseibacillus songhuajiangensis]